MIRTEKTHLKSVARSHAGMSGKNNEDRYGVSAFLLNEESATPVLLSIMADGIGGHRAGEVAAEMVVDIVSQKVAQSDGSNPPATLKEAIQTASNEVYSLAQAEEGRKGMGATVVCTLIIGKRLFTAYVGDSRIYLLRDGQILRLSRDHSWIQEAIDSGILTEEQAVGHPNAHVIRRYVGSPEPPEVDFRLRLNPEESDRETIENQGTPLKNGDQLLLCSDGLTDLVQDHEILSFIQENSHEEAVEKLIDLANERGGHDNITLVLIKVPEGVFVEKKPQPKPAAVFPVRTVALGCLGVVVIGLLVVAGIFGVRWLNGAQTTGTATLDAAVTQQLPSQTLIESTSPASSGVVSTALPSQTLSQNDLSTTQEPSGSSGSSQEGNIPPPPEAENMTAFPTHTLAPTQTLTPTTTVTQTVTGTP